MRVVKLIWRLAAVGVAAMVSTTAFTQEYYLNEQPQMVTVSAANLELMSRRIEALEASLGLKDGKDGKSMWEDVSAQGWSQKWGGRIMGDYVMVGSQNAASLTRFGDLENSFEFRRLRFACTGEGYGIYDYELELDFEPERDGSNGIDAPFVAMKDVFFGIHEVPFAGYVRFGHHKAPFSLEELTSSRFITFMERSLPNVFAPQREVGITSFNHSANQRWTWAGGVYFDEILEGYKQYGNVGGVLPFEDGDRQGTTLAGRVTWTPIYDEPSDGRYMMHLGLSGRYTDDKDDRIRFRARPEDHEGPRFIDSGPFAGDWWTGLGPELAVVWGPFSMQAEYVYTQADDEGAGLTRDFHSAYIYGSWFLTGEHRPYSRTKGTFGRIEPFTNFWIVRGAGIGTGAVELAARWAYLDLSGLGYEVDPAGPPFGAGSGTMNDLTLGVNWYWNPHLRWMFNYVHTWNEYDVAGRPNAENDILAFRGQVDF